MTGWGAVDVVLLLLLAAAVAVMYRRQASLAAMPSQVPGRPRPGGRAGGPLARYTARLVREAGYHPDAARPVYWTVKVALAAALPLLLLELPAWGLPGVGPTGLLLAALLGFWAPDLWLVAARRTRRRRIAAALSHFLDLIVALLMSGSSLEAAVRRAGRAGFAGGHPLAREVELMGLELEVGQDPAVAFESLAERTGLAAAVGLASALRLGTRVGSSIQATLEAQADLLWHNHVEQVRRRIDTASVAAVFAVLLCGLPVFAVLGLFPIVVDLVETLDLFLGP